MSELDFDSFHQSGFGHCGVHFVTGPSSLWDAEIGTFWLLSAFKMQIGWIESSQKILPNSAV